MINDFVFYKLIDQSKLSNQFYGALIDGILLRLFLKEERLIRSKLCSNLELLSYTLTYKLQFELYTLYYDLNYNLYYDLNYNLNYNLYYDLRSDLRSL